MDKLLEAHDLLEKASELIEASGVWPGLACEALELADAVDAAATAAAL